MLIENLIDRFESDPEKYAQEWTGFVSFLDQIYNSFKLNYDWFIRTQESNVLPYTYRWQGRTPTYCLTSGMDDYPRAPFLTTQEAHLDLQTWLIVSARTLGKIG